jgi:hypothetical protein
MFLYSKNGLTVSYQGKIVKSLINGVKPVETVLSDDDCFTVEVNGDCRKDKMTNEIKSYIQNSLNNFITNEEYHENNEDNVQIIGDKICELYYDIIV